MFLHRLAAVLSLQANDPKPHTVGQGQPIDIPGTNLDFHCHLSIAKKTVGRCAVSYKRLLASVLSEK
jgi:hypothetical protein